jgi:hypothetical protein
MVQRNKQMKVLAIFTALLIAIALHSTATAQTVSASGSRTTVPVTSGAASTTDDVCEQRLLKTLDALDKAEKALAFAVNEIDARAKLDALKDQLIGVKDLIISSQDELIKRLQKKDTGVWARVKKILTIAEKAALIAVGIYVGRGL